MRRRIFVGTVLMVLHSSGCGLTSSKGRTEVLDPEAPPNLSADTQPGGRIKKDPKRQDSKQVEAGTAATPANDKVERQSNKTSEKEVAAESDQAFDVQGTPLETLSKVRKFLAEAGIDIDSDDDQRPMLQTDWISSKSARSRERFKIWVSGDKAVSHVRLVSEAEVLQAQQGEIAWTSTAPNAKRQLEMATKLRKTLEGRN